MPTVMYDDPFNATRATGKHTLKALVIPFDFRRSRRSPCMMVLYIHNGRWKTVIDNKVNVIFRTDMTSEIRIELDYDILHYIVWKLTQKRQITKREAD